jgi:hypothetical protein
VSRLDSGAERLSERYLLNVTDKARPPRGGDVRQVAGRHNLLNVTDNARRLASVTLSRFWAARAASVTNGPSRTRPWGHDVAVAAGLHRLGPSWVGPECEMMPGCAFPRVSPATT